MMHIDLVSTMRAHGRKRERELNYNPPICVHLPLIRTEIHQNMHWVALFSWQHTTQGGTEWDKWWASKQERYLKDIRKKPPSSWSPEKNALDGRVWCSLQSEVEKVRQNRRSMEELTCWYNTKIFNRIPKVLRLIVDHNGENDLVVGRDEV